MTERMGDEVADEKHAEMESLAKREESGGRKSGDEEDLQNINWTFQRQPIQNVERCGVEGRIQTHM